MGIYQCQRLRLVKYALQVFKTAPHPGGVLAVDGNGHKSPGIQLGQAVDRLQQGQRLLRLAAEFRCFPTGVDLDQDRHPHVQLGATGIELLRQGQIVHRLDHIE